MGTPTAIRTLALAALAAGSLWGFAREAAAVCGAIPASNPVYSGSTFSVGNNVTMNGNPVGAVSGNTLRSNGKFTTTTPALPTLSPASYPANAATGTVTTAGAVVAGFYNTLNITATPTVFNGSGGGTYYIRTLNFQGNNRSAQFAPGDYYIETLVMGSVGNAITISPAGTVRLFIKTLFDANASGIVINNCAGAGCAANLQVFLYPGAVFRLNQPNAIFKGLVYSPHSDTRVELRNNAQLTGAIVTAGQVSIDNNSALTYDAATAAALGSVQTCPRLIAEYRMDETSWSAAAGQVGDSSGNGLNATAVSGATTAGASPAVAGSPGTCRYGAFNGSQYVQLPAGFPTLTSDYTIATWFRTSAVNDIGQRILIDDQESSGSTGWGFSYNDAGGRVLRFYSRNINPVILDSTLQLSANTWYFVAAVADFTRKRRSLYVFNQAGTLLNVTTDSAAFTGTWGSDAGPATIGGETNASAENDLRLSGNLDEMRVFGSALTQADLQEVLARTRACTGGVDHYAVTNPVTGVNCQAENVTITAHDASHNPVTPGTTINVTARRVAGAAGNRGDWSVVTGTPANLGNGTADDGVATFTFGAGESQVVLALKDTWAQTVNVDVTDTGGITDTSGTASLDAGYNQNLAFSAAGFRFVDGAGSPIGSQVAGVTSGTFNLQAIQSTGCATPGACTGVCQAVFVSGTSAGIDLAFQCNDPVACQPGQQVSFTNNAATTALPANPAAGVASYTAVPVRFGANSSAAFTIRYPDVGRISLHARYTIPLGTGAASSNLMTGAGGPFVVKPWDLAVTNVRRTAGAFANPGAAGAAGAVFAKAGEPLTLTVIALNAANGATPNFGREVVPEGVVINSALVAGLGLASNPAPGNGVIPGTEFGAGGMVSDTDGRATVNNLYWGEVGIVRLSAAVADGDYLGAGNVTGSATGNVGRFTPADFGVTYNTPGFGAGCSAGPSAFTYVGQRFAFQTAPVMTVTARNVQGNTTANYTGAWWKIANGSLAGRAYTAYAGPGPVLWTLDTGGLPPAASDPAIVDGGSGSGTLTFSAGSGLAFQRSTPVAAFDADVSLALNVADSDGIAFAGNPARFGAATAGTGIAFNGSKQMRFGRLRLANAYGTQTLDLPVPMEAQYFRDLGGGVSGFVTNTDDSCTAIVPAAVSLSPALTTASGAGTLVNGRGTLRLAKPGSRGTTSVCVDLDAGAGGDATCAAGTPADRSFLQGNWTGGAWSRDPRAQATFGIYRGSPDMIFQRENY